MKKLLSVIAFLFIICSVSAKVTIVENDNQLDVQSDFIAKDKKYTIRNSRPGDEKYYHRAISNAKLNETYFAEPEDGEFFATSADARKRFYDRYMEKWKNKDPWTNYLIFDDQDQFVGWVSLQTYVSHDPNEIGIAYIILPEFQKKGIASAAVKEIIDEIVLKNLVLKYQPTRGDAKIIVTQVIVDNTPSVKVLEKNGFFPSADFEMHGATRRWYLRSLMPQQA